MAGIFATVFEAIFDFVTKGGLKKTVIALMVLSLVAVSGAYLVYPQTTTSVALSAIGATPEGQFEPPSIEGNDTVGYVGEFSGTGGPTGVPIEGEIRAEVNFDTGRVVATAEGDRVEEGYLEGEVDPETGETSGTGSVNAFGLTGIDFTFEGEYAEDGSSAEG
ncbi:MAG: hypothetical protein ACLFSW_03200, partial [Halobacteriales archaeon]